MKKYWIIIANSIQSIAAYRFNVFASILANVIVLVVFAYLWSSIYGDGNKIGNYTLNGIIVYFVISNFVTLIIKSQNLARNINISIHEGGFTQYLLKPISHIRMTLANNMSISAYSAGIYSIVFVPVIIFISKESFDLARIFYFITFLVIGYSINFFIFYAIGISTFYFDNVQGFNYIFGHLSFFLAGNLLPLDILPAGFSSIVSVLPFKYMAYLPITYLMRGDTGALIRDYAIGILWIAVLYFISKLVYKFGIKKYESIGI